MNTEQQRDCRHGHLARSCELCVIWRPISEAPKTEPLWLYAEAFRDDDFNPTGVVDGFYHEGEGVWVIWKWNGEQDCYDTIDGATPTHFAQKLAPAI